MNRSCKKCGEYIPTAIRVNGKKRNLQNRKFCLICSPYKHHNTRDLTKPPTKSELEKRKTSAAMVTKYRKRLKRKLIEYKGGKCQRCGYDKDIPNVYDFHHRNPDEKEFTISSNMSKSFDILTEEVDKCDILCKNCHAEIHYSGE